MNASIRFFPLLVAVAVAPWAGAAELPAGFVLDGGTLDAHLEDSFEGHRIGDLVPEKFQWAMREHGLAMRLKASEPLPVDPRYEEASAANAGRSFDPKASKLEGWQAGRPFAAIADDDPDAARKVVWNFFLAQELADTWFWPAYAFVMVDGRRGLDRVQTWSMKRVAMKGRLADPATAVLEPGNILQKNMNIALAPSDVRGTGIFTIAYDDGRLSDQWVYLPDQRRSRRMSGGTWMDPIGTTDILADDFALWAAHPDWYPQLELVGRRWILATPLGTRKIWDTQAGSDPTAQFPALNLGEAPYWNTIEDWQPREVFVIKATPPPEHPYSYKLVYFDTQRALAYLMEAYGKDGNLRKIGIQAYRAWPLADRPDASVLFAAWAGFYDYSTMHSTMVYPSGEGGFNQSFTPEDVTLRIMEQIAK